MDREWRCQKYGPLGWMEALIKVIAIGVGIGSLAVFSKAKRKLQATRIAEIVLMAVAGALILAQVVHRVLDKELFALGLSIFHVVGHWILVLVVILSDDPGAFLFTYCFLMVLSEYIHIMFVALADNLEVRFMTKPIMIAISAVFILIYLAVIVVQIVIWLVQY